MTYATISISSRIEWCRRQSTQACAPLELAGWQAEEEGLRDALLNSERTTQYQQGPPGVVERYMMGLQDGLAMLRTAAVYHQFATPTRATGALRHAAIDGSGDVSTRRMLGLTRHCDPYL